MPGSNQCAYILPNIKFKAWTCLGTKKTTTTSGSLKLRLLKKRRSIVKHSLHTQTTVPFE